MRKVKFNRNGVAHLDKPLNVGDIIEVTDMCGIKSNLMVCIDDDKPTDCSECVFNAGTNLLCRDSMIRPLFDKDDRALSPCNALLLHDDKEYEFTHCIYYKNMDTLLEDL